MGRSGFGPQESFNPSLVDMPVPASPDTEKAILGACLDSAVEFAGIHTQLSVEDFHSQVHRETYQTMRDLYDSGRPTDLISVAVEMTAANTGGPGILSYLTGISKGTAELVPGVADHWCHILRDKSQRRRIIAYTNEIQRRCFDETQDIPEILANSERQLAIINSHEYVELDLQLPREIIEEYGGIENFIDPQTSVPLSTPWRNINWQLGGGYRQGELVILAARPSVGKSTKAMQLAAHWAFEGYGVAVFPLEMKARQILLRALASRARVDGMAMRRPGDLNQAERISLLNAAGDFVDLETLWISKKHSATVGSIEAALRKLKSSGNRLDVVVIDYLQLIQSVGRFENRVQEISAMTRALKLLAMELGITIYLLSQLSRGPEKNRQAPTLTDLRESGSIEQDADIVEFLHWPEKEKELEYEIRNILNILAKQREGPLGTTQMAYHARHFYFEEARLAA